VALRCNIEASIGKRIVQNIETPHSPCHRRVGASVGLEVQREARLLVLGGGDGGGVVCGEGARVKPKLPRGVMHALGEHIHGDSVDTVTATATPAPTAKPPPHIHGDSVDTVTATATATPAPTAKPPPHIHGDSVDTATATATATPAPTAKPPPHTTCKKRCCDSCSRCAAAQAAGACGSSRGRRPSLNTWHKVARTPWWCGARRWSGGLHGVCVGGWHEEERRNVSPGR
jgi:hypothetical protein